ncbi:hypothetical protein AK812_SmicGene5480 [Symbiodinium microadriaticum]|uniref:Uncharacterized protein n=1 Tax=Symbiodinium microadriaticum TaxID=2951 RepID=A0A1Q9ETI8_SYMMI|nr:hypothetical protein AK812_SmicGene5480 [Symbiodinium microadriaticum]
MALCMTDKYCAHWIVPSMLTTEKLVRFARRWRGHNLGSLVLEWCGVESSSKAANPGPTAPRYSMATEPASSPLQIVVLQLMFYVVVVVPAPDNESPPFLAIRPENLCQPENVFIAFQCFKTSAPPLEHLAEELQLQQRCLQEEARAKRYRKGMGMGSMGIKIGVAGQGLGRDRQKTEQLADRTKATGHRDSPPGGRPRMYHIEIGSLHFLPLYITSSGDGPDATLDPNRRRLLSILTAEAGYIEEKKLLRSVLPVNQASVGATLHLGSPTPEVKVSMQALRSATFSESDRGYEDANVSKLAAKMCQRSSC